LRFVFVTALTFAAVLLHAACAPARAADDDTSGASTLSANVTLASDYRFRGQSQTDHRAAFQGGIDYAHASGVFAGLWSSTINFNDEANSPAEVDFTAGYSHAFSETTEASLAAAYYWYPESEPADYDFFEILGTASHDLTYVTLSAEWTFSFDYSGHAGIGTGIAGGIDVPLPVGESEWLSGSAHWGYQWIEDNALYGVPDWMFYDFGMTATWRMFALDVRYMGSDLSKAECYGGSNVCEPGVVVSLTLTVPLN